MCLHLGKILGWLDVIIIKVTNQEDDYSGFSGINEVNYLPARGINKYVVN